MEAEAQVLLTQIRANLQEVGDRLSAIDHNLGSTSEHWKAITAIGNRVREAALELPDDLLAQYPQLTDFTRSTRGLEGCWSFCVDEIEALIS